MIWLIHCRRLYSYSQNATPTNLFIFHFMLEKGTFLKEVIEHFNSIIVMLRYRLIYLFGCSYLFYVNSFDELFWRILHKNFLISFKKFKFFLKTHNHLLDLPFSFTFMNMQLIIKNTPTRENCLFFYIMTINRYVNLSTLTRIRHIWVENSITE